ncbi:MAG: ParB/RepB/Spo0J family partition protein [Kiritimatiellae bacterium]|nr:ParB/RepB/Spo0J family partition protein [Kiritimatiellia bacterium]
MKSTERMISVGELTTCPWNPRREITPESVKDLTASIQARGLLQNIGVWKRPDAPGYYVIFGNRRFVACVNAMLSEVRCRVFECSEVEAHELTRIENEARLGVSPIEDAKLVGKMFDLGYNGKEIAAHFGVSEACVTRRRKLLDLSPGWVGRAERVEIPADALEGVSAYPREIQDRVLAKVSDWNLREGWSFLKRFFADVTFDLDSEWDFAGHCPELAERCKACPNRTGAQPDLFGDVEGGLGRCLDRKCFKGMHNAWIAKLVDDAIPADVTERIRCDEYQMYSSDLEKKPKKGKKAAYYCVEIRKDFAKVKVKYGPGKAAKKAAEAKRKAAEEKKGAEAKAREKLVKSAKEKISAWAKKNNPGDVALAWATVNGAVDPWRAIYAYEQTRASAAFLDTLLKGGANAFVAVFADTRTQLETKSAWSRDIVRLSQILPGMLDDLTSEELKALKEQEYF